MKEHFFSHLRVNHYSRSPHRYFSGNLAAFTLIEILVVIAIISILLTIGGLGLKNLSRSSGVSAGIPVAESLFDEARSLAVGKGTKARVLIHAQQDSSDEYHRERYLRYMAVQYLDDNGTPDDKDDDKWVLASKGSSLPKGVYFMAKYMGAKTPQKTTVTLPGNSSAECYYYEFNAEGIMSDPAPQENDLPRFVIGSGSLPPGKAEPITRDKNLGGFVIWRNGRTSVFRHIDQIAP